MTATALLLGPCSRTSLQLKQLPDCDTTVQEVFELTGYDGVMMAYKFHDDDHGEVVSEITKPGLEPYLGLHYPSTDIPQASPFLFMKNKVRMIVDCCAKQVKVLQDEKLPFDLRLCGSINPKSPTYSCHSQYMKTREMMRLPVLIPFNLKKETLGLVVCHNMYNCQDLFPFPLRYACKFLAQVFGIHANKEIELEDQMVEKNILRTQNS